jgi:RNA polymerase sigma-70 factor, ECF subfamily
MRAMDLGYVLERCREGDELAWETLVREYQGRIYGMAYHYMGNPEDARDMAQEIFVRIFRSLHLCTEPQWFTPWAIRISRNLCIDQLRRRKARPPSQDISADEFRDLPAGGLDPEQQWAQQSRRQLVQRAMGDLTGLSREIIILRDIQGLPIEEIASMLNVPLGTIKSRCNRARIELARRVQELTGEEAAAAATS